MSLLCVTEKNVDPNAEDDIKNLSMMWNTEEKDLIGQKITKQIRNIADIIFLTSDFIHSLNMFVANHFWLISQRWQHYTEEFLSSTKQPSKVAFYS